MEYIGAIEWSAVPCISSSHGSRYPNSRVVAVIDSNGGGLVDEAEVLSNADGLVVTLCYCMIADIQDFTHGFKDGKKSAGSVNDNHTTHAKF